MRKKFDHHPISKARLMRTATSVKDSNLSMINVKAPRMMLKAMLAFCNEKHIHNKDGWTTKWRMIWIGFWFRLNCWFYRPHKTLKTVLGIKLTLPHPTCEMTPNWTSPLRYAGPTNKAGMAKVASNQKRALVALVMISWLGGLLANMQIWRRLEKDNVAERKYLHHAFEFEADRQILE